MSIIADCTARIYTAVTAVNHFSNELHENNVDLAVHTPRHLAYKGAMVHAPFP